MAYCPQCGREQKCGCEICHHCGVPLIGYEHDNTEALSARSVADEISAAVTDGLEVEEEARAESGEELGRETTRATASAVLPLLLLILGCGILLIALVEVIHTASDFFRPAVSSASGAAAVKHFGYYLGTLLYNSSVRLLIGFALVAAGLFYAPPQPFSSGYIWSRTVRALGITMGVLGALCLIAAILIVIPGSLSLIVRNLLPSPVTSISVFVVMGIALIAGCYLVVTRSREGEVRSRRGAGTRHPRSGRKR